MEMYPQKRFAPGRRRINAAQSRAHHPILDFFPGTRVFVLLCFISHVPIRATFVFLCFIKLKLSRDHTKWPSRSKQRRLRHQDHHPNDHLPYWKLNDALEESPTSGRLRIFL